MLTPNGLNYFMQKHKGIMSAKSIDMCFSWI